MSLRDTFARGFVWKLAGLLALAAFGWLAGMGEAKAQNYSQCFGVGPGNNGTLCQTMDDAYAAAKASAELYITQNAHVQPPLSLEPGSETAVDGLGRIFVSVFVLQNGSRQSQWYKQAANPCAPGSTWSPALGKCEVPCNQRPDKGPTWVKGTSNAGASSICDEGCLYVGDLANVIDDTTVDGSRYTKFASMNPWGDTCVAGGNNDGDGTTEAPPSDSDGDGTSDGNDTAPSNPGQGAGGGGDEPSGEDDQPGEGSGNGNTSSGGGDCGTAPNSHGDQIAAQTAYQTWATRCAIERAQEEDGTLKTKQATGTGTGTGGTGTGGLGTCSASEVGTALCTMKEGIAAIKGFFDGIGSEAGGLDTTEGETEEPGSVWADENDPELDLDASGFGFAGGSCPAPPTYMGTSLDPGGNMCLFAMIIGALVLAAAYVQAAYIVGRG